MDEYTLMELSWRKGVKNVICHLLAPRKTISLFEVEETRSYMVAIDSGVRYCFTGNPNIIDADSQYVILTDRTPTKQKLLEGAVKQKRWLRHPRMWDHTPEVVLRSWTNQFSYKEEVDEEHPGLRRPQLGAMKSIVIGPKCGRNTYGMIQSLFYQRGLYNRDLQVLESYCPLR